MKKKAAKAVTKHLKEDNKDCKKEIKEHNALVKKVKASQKKAAKKPTKKK